jgi:hypothetical protein
MLLDESRRRQYELPLWCHGAFLRLRARPRPGDQLHVLLNNGALPSYKVAIGEQVYHRQIGGGSFSASPAVDEGKIYCSIPKRENSTAIKSR